jgi:predicted Zn-dependent protease
MAYEKGRFAECGFALQRFVALQPRMGPAWGLRGLCEFRLERYALAGPHLQKALDLGPVSDEPLWRVIAYHRALLRIKAAEFELALPALTDLARAQGESAELVDACGLVLLRRRLLPSQVPAADRGLVAAAGRAECAYLARRGSEARVLFRELLEAHPRQRHLHYGYGLFLAQEGDAEALSAFEKEIELHPDHVLAHVELAFGLLTRGEAARARAAAEKATALAPKLFAARLALGRALVAEGALARGIVELETAAGLAPRVPEIHLALWRAYAAAGRSADAERARRTFARLEAARPGSRPPSESGPRGSGGARTPPRERR